MEASDETGNTGESTTEERAHGSEEETQRETEENRDGECIDDAEEEALVPKRSRDPAAPTTQEVHEHKVAHLPFRRWCIQCMQGRGNNLPHSEAPAAEDGLAVPVVALDFYFVGQPDTPDIATALAARDKGSKALFSRILPTKATLETAWAAQQIVQDLEWLGHKKCILKADQEPAMTALLNKIVSLREHPTILERSPVGESQANGLAERAVQAAEGQLRVMKLALEQRLQGDMPPKHPVVAWLTQHAADMVTKLHRRSDGRTSYELVKGKPYRSELVEFGQRVLFRLPGKFRGGDMQPRWQVGTWLGKARLADEHIIAPSATTTVRSRAIRSLPESQSWDIEAIESIRSTPWDPNPEEDQEEEVPNVIRREEAEAQPIVRDEERQAPKAVQIRKPDLDRWGYTEGCMKCMDMMRGDTSQPTRGHSAKCRDRVLIEMRKDPELLKKVEASDKRKEEYLRRRQEERSRKETEEAEADKHSKRIRAEGQEPEATAAPGPAKQSTVTTDVTTPLASSREPTPDTRAADRRAEAAGEGASSSTSPVEARTPIGAMRVPVTPTRQAREDQRTQEADAGTSRKRRGDPLDDGNYQEREEESRRHRKRKTPDPVDDLMVLHAIGYESDMDVSEMFSPPRITPFASRAGLKAGWSMDIASRDPWSGVSWDLGDRQVQAKALRLIAQHKPNFLILSPPCTMFSNLQNLNRSKGSKEWLKKYEKALELFRFSLLVCLIQQRSGRYFMLEHPSGASSWRTREALDVLAMRGVHTVKVDMCAFGLKTRGDQGQDPEPAKKPTTIMTNSPSILNGIARRCAGDHRHRHLVSGRAAMAAKYTDEFCKQVVKCMETQRRHDEQNSLAILNVADSSGHDTEEERWSEYFDDRTGGYLNAGKVQAARRQEIERLEEMKVYKRVPRAVATARGFRPIDTRWVDTDKAVSGQSEQIKSRCVVKEIAYTKRDDVFAGTPSLEAFKILISKLASSNGGKSAHKRLLVLDVKRAFLYANMDREVYIELPPEAKHPGEGDVVGVLLKAMYGTRDAPQQWQGHITMLLRRLGFAPGVSQPCVFHHPLRDLQLVVHVDDIACLGEPQNLEWFRKELARLVECKASVLGPGDGERLEVNYLGRRIRWTETGIHYEHDERHVRSALETAEMSTSKPVTTPGSKEMQDDNAEDLKPEEAAVYRRVTAIINYISQDRPDLSYAIKECARKMSSPTSDDLRKLKRILRYLRHEPVRGQHFAWQCTPREVLIYSDADWAGCTRSRRSTSGGVCMIGSHTVKTWSRTQATVALSSAESELGAAVKASAEALGLIATAQELDMRMSATVLLDSSACHGIIRRQGSGKLKHIRTQQLWVQEAAAAKRITYCKVPRELNLSDLLTHHWDAGPGERMLSAMGCVASEAEHEPYPCADDPCATARPRGGVGTYGMSTAHWSMQRDQQMKVSRCIAHSVM